MYKHSSGQTSLEDFRRSVGMHLKEDNPLGEEGADHPLAGD